MARIRTRFKDLREPKLFRWFTVSLLKLLLFTRIKVRVKHKRKLPKENKIFVVNHPTATDPFIISATFPNAKMLINKDVFDIKILGWMLNKVGHIPTDIIRGTNAYSVAMKALEEGFDLIIFPEANFSWKAETLRDFKTGAIRLALETNKPIIPIGIQVDQENIKLHKFYNPEGVELYNQWYSKGKYDINIGKSIKLKGSPNNRDYVKKKTRYLQQEIQKLCRK